MTPPHSNEVWAWQLLAAVLMGSDYLLSEARRAAINKWIVSHLARFEAKFGGLTARTFAGLKDALFFVLKGLLPAVSGAALIGSMSHITWWTEVTIPSVGVVAFLLIGVGIVFSYMALFRALGFLRLWLFIYSVPLYAISKFLRYSPKGALAGVGFLCLLNSFRIRLA